VGGIKRRNRTSELYQTTPLTKTTPLSSTPSPQKSKSNMPAQTRTLGDKTFNAIGYGGMGLSIAYGSVGTDEERLKVVLFTFPVVADH